MDLPAKIFEEIKKINEYGGEYWSARELAKILGYLDYRNFEAVLNKARESCSKAHQSIDDHFVDVTDMIKLPKNNFPHREWKVNAAFAINGGSKKASHLGGGIYQRASLS